MTIYTNLKDAHVYIFSHWVLDLLADKPNIVSIQGELVPYLVRSQRGKATAAYVKKIQSNKSSLAQSMTHTEDADAHDERSVFAFVAPANKYVERVNTVPQFYKVNRELPVQPVSDSTPWQPFQETNFIEDARERCPSKHAIGSACLIGPGLDMGAKSSIKKSVIGKHCKIGVGVKISHSVVLDYVNIGDGAVISNCTLCSGVQVGEKSKLTDTTVGHSFQIPPKTVCKGETKSVSTDNKWESSDY
eukprot:TRINITY_DN66837_c2_g1_i1.p1 TRINITY_DN66837_c2_g1~~TRINITY_DN66837_c2_g1_i1.p1  ORF type:complete len:288 (-),score=164.35 TRINITY_DN66837_c2_g1_i1:435-1172(-)